MPGHERFVRTMISGATGIDAVLLVVAANEGIKPQTVEHIDIAGLLGLRRAVVAISKTDLVAPEASQTSRRRRGAVARAVRSRSAAAGHDLGAAGTGHRRVASGARQPWPQTSVRALPTVWLPADRPGIQHRRSWPSRDRNAARRASRSWRHAGVVAVCAERSECRAVQVHGATVTTALPGQRVALNLRDIEIAELQRGMALAAPDTLALSDWLTISIRAVDRRPAAQERDEAARAARHERSSTLACACWIAMCSRRARPASPSCTAPSRSRSRPAST